MQLPLLGISLLLYTLTLCSAKKQTIQSGVVRVKRQMFNSGITALGDSALTTEYRIWYKDRFAIQEVKMLRIKTDTTDRQSVEHVVTHYTFMDPDTHSFYYYKEFSDTVKAFLQYSGIDSFSVHGGWNFYTKRNIDYKGDPVLLADSVINHVQYKRVRFNRQKGKSDYVSIGYFRCDKKGTMFKLDQSYSEKLGCPLVRLDEFPVSEGSPRSIEIIFEADTLTNAELKVFETWESNAKQGSK
jgi:hypothetical protein